MKQEQGQGLSLADRMKKLEDVSRFYLAPKQPILVRIDGKNFSKYTKQKWINKPFSDIISTTFQKTTLQVCKEVQNVEFAYHQSDEVSFFLKDYTRKKQNQFFDGNVQKISSVIASKFTYWFNFFINELLVRDGLDVILIPAEFDCRTFSLPITEVSNYFIWRQRDAIKNSITMLARHHFSDKDLHNKNSNEKIQMLLLEKDVDWNKISLCYQRGTAFKKVEVEIPVPDLSKEEIDFLIKKEIEPPEMVTRKKWSLDSKTPIFSDQKEYIETIVYQMENDLGMLKQLELF